MIDIFTWCRKSNKQLRHYVYIHLQYSTVYNRVSLDLKLQTGMSYVYDICLYQCHFLPLQVIVIGHLVDSGSKLLRNNFTVFSKLRIHSRMYAWLALIRMKRHSPLYCYSNMLLMYVVFTFIGVVCRRREAWAFLPSWAKFGFLALFWAQFLSPNLNLRLCHFFHLPLCSQNYNYY